MHMRNLLVSAVLFLAAVTAARAQVETPQQGQGPMVRQNVYGLGLFGGPATGLGLSFRHHPPGYGSYQITGGIIKVGSKISSDIGLELQYDLIRSMPVRFYVGGGVSYFYSGKSGRNRMSAPGRAGLGIGTELLAGLGVHAECELMFCYFTDGTVLPLPQIGFFYYFF
jgi:hypothetical protein